MTHGENQKSTLVFSDKINAEYNFDIRSGEVTIYIDNDMTLTNENVVPKRSAINIEPNAKLNLYIAKDVTLTVNSGFGQDIPIASIEQSIGGKGGYAGIRVPWIDFNNNGERDKGEQAEFDIYGEGKLVAYGGDAADGAGTISGSVGGAGGRTEREHGIGRKPVEMVEMAVKIT